METLRALFGCPAPVDLSEKSYAEIINWLHSTDFKAQNFSPQQIKANERLTEWQRYWIFQRYQQKIAQTQ